MIAAVQPNRGPTSHVMSVAKFERFFRVAAGLDVDKQDLKRYSDFINRKVYDLLLQAEAVAKANGRVVIEPFDLPITRACSKASSNSKRSNYDRSSSILPPSCRLSSIMAKMPKINCLRSGGLSVALARTFKIIDGDLKNPATRHWQQCFRIFDLLM
jgi:hypothetical protein